MIPELLNLSRMSSVTEVAFMTRPGFSALFISIVVYEDGTVDPLTSLTAYSRVWFKKDNPHRSPDAEQSIYNTELISQRLKDYESKIF